MSHRTTRSFEIICHGGKVGLADQHTMYHKCTISDILRQGVESLAQLLEHCISTPAIAVRIPSGTWDFFFV